MLILSILARFAPVDPCKICSVRSLQDLILSILARFAHFDPCKIDQIGCPVRLSGWHMGHGCDAIGVGRDTNATRSGHELGHGSNHSPIIHLRLGGMGWSVKHAQVKVTRDTDGHVQEHGKYDPVSIGGKLQGNFSGEWFEWLSEWFLNDFWMIFEWFEWSSNDRPRHGK
jgi:hypothetical protein